MYRKKVDIFMSFVIHDIINIMKTDYKVMLVIGLLTVALIIGLIWFGSKESEQRQKKLAKLLIGEKIADQGGAHIARNATHPPYNSNPPTSGWHWGNGTAGPGIKNKAVPDELVVHSMEHGAAVVWYRDDLPQSDVDKIKEAFNNSSGKKIMLPRKDLDVPVALTSWGYLLKLESIDEGKIKEFIETNNDRAPEKAPI